MPDGFSPISTSQRNNPAKSVLLESNATVTTCNHASIITNIQQIAQFTWNNSLCFSYKHKTTVTKAQ